MPLAIDACAFMPLPALPLVQARSLVCAQRTAPARPRVRRRVVWVVQAVLFAAVMALLVAGPGFVSDGAGTTGPKRVNVARVRV